MVVVGVAVGVGSAAVVVVVVGVVAYDSLPPEVKGEA